VLLKFVILAQLAIEHATVIPMDRDTALADQTVLVSGNRIVWVGPSRSARVPSAAQRVNGRGRFVMPGLADMHVHIEHVEDLPRSVAAGVTTIRNMRGGPRYLAWRARVAGGALVGPTIYTTGPTVVGGRRSSPEFVRVRTVRDAERVAREQSRAGYDMIKVHSGLTPAVYQRLVQVARETKIPVVGHIIPAVGLARALSAGQVSFEHAEIGLFDDRAQLAEGARAIAQAGAWVGTILSSRDGRCTPPDDMQRSVIGAMRRANVKLLAGSDASLDPLRAGTALHCELETLVNAGLTPYEALVTATRHAGEFARIHLKEPVPFGTVAAGARADLVVLAADPRADIRALANPIGTVLRGVWHPR
jgi:imidazolonepropionase-like amidohydrolase